MTVVLKWVREREREGEVKGERYTSTTMTTRESRAGEGEVLMQDINDRHWQPFFDLAYPHTSAGTGGRGKVEKLLPAFLPSSSASGIMFAHSSRCALASGGFVGSGAVGTAGRSG